MNPYAAPGAPPAVPVEDDIAAAAAPAIARVAGGVVFLAGVVGVLTGVQTLALVRVYGPFALAPYVLVALGVPGLVLGPLLFRARVAAAAAAMGQTALLAIVASVWLVFSVGNGLFTLFALGEPWCAVAGFILALLALGPCRLATAARGRLRSQGLNLGI